MAFRRSRKWIIIGAAAAVIAGVAGVVARLAWEPKYNGNTIYELADTAVALTNTLRLRGISDAEARGALETLRHMGPELDRFLIKELQARDRFWQSRYEPLYRSASAQSFRRYLP